MRSTIALNGPWLVAALLLTFGLFGVKDARAQTRATLTGTIRNESALALAGATLTLENATLAGDTQTAVTDATGRYRLAELTPGLYQVTASFLGLQTVQRRLRVPIGSTLIVDFVLNKSEPSGVVTISGEGPVVDVTSVASTTKLTREDLENLPLENGVGILQAVPGVTPITAFGVGVDGSELAADGGPIAVGNGPRFPTAAVHVYWMDQAQIVSLGAGADQSEFSGVTANVALRSGSNRVSGLFEHRASPTDWVADNTAALEEPLRSRFQPQEILSRWASNAQVGGPIVRDRLFFFTGFAYAKNKVVQAGTIGNVPFEQRSPAFLTKLTWAPRRNLQVLGFVEADRQREVGTLGRNALPETANDRTTRIQTHSGQATWTLNSRTQAEVRGGGVKLDFTGIPNARRAGPAPRTDRVTGLRSGNLQQFQDVFSGRYHLGGGLTRFVGGSGPGTHVFRSGLEIERRTYGQFTGFPGGRSFTDASGVPETVVLWAGDSVQATGTRISLFVQDAWRPADRITIHPGVRLNMNFGSVPEKGSVFRTNPVSPRIGIAWDVASDHKTVARFGYGRLHEELYTSVFHFMSTSGRTPRITARVVGADMFEETDRTAPDNVMVDEHLAHASVDQYSIGVERELFEDFSLVVQYLGRYFRNIWALTDTGSNFVPVQRRDPGPDGRLDTADDGAWMTVFDLLNPGQSTTVLANPDDAHRDYRAFQVIGQKRFSRNWSWLGAYTWSRTHGNVNPAAGEHRVAGPETNASGVFFHPNRRINAAGPVGNDYPHQLTLEGVYVVPRWGGVGVSATYRFLSGGAAGRTATITGLQQRNQVVRVEPRGTRRIESASALDMRIEKIFRIAGPRRSLGIYADLLNLTNEGVPFGMTIVEQSGDTFGEPNGWADPRAVRIAGRLKW